MILAVIGCGNVGANLLMHCADMAGLDRIFAMDLSEDMVNAAIMDIAGVKPYSTRTIHIVSNSELSQADIIVLCAGVKSKKGQSYWDIKDKNIAVINHYLENISLKGSAIFITLPAPVEYLATYRAYA